jgi:hypothetical protein
MKEKDKETKCSSQLVIKETERRTEKNYTQRMKQKDKETNCSSQLAFKETDRRT